MIALIVTAGSQTGDWIGLARDGWDRARACPSGDLMTTEGLVLGSIVDGVSRSITSTQTERIVVTLDRPPGNGGESARFVFRLRALLYPRTIDFLFPDRSGRWHVLDLNYRRPEPRQPLPDLASGLASARWWVVPGGLSSPPSGFSRATPEGAFGWALYSRDRVGTKSSLSHQAPVSR